MVFHAKENYHLASTFWIQIGCISISEKFKTRTFPYSVNMVFVQVMFVKVEVMLVQVNQFVQVNHFVNLFVNLFAQIM